MKKLTLFVAILAMSPLLGAQNIKLGYINAQEVMMLMPEISQIEKEMADYTAKSQQYMQDMQKEIQEKAAKYEQQADSLTDAIRKVKEQELQTLYQRYQSAQETLYSETQNKQQKRLEPVQTKVKNAITTVAKKGGFTYIFDTGTGAVLYKSDQAIDITAQVKKELGIL